MISHRVRLTRLAKAVQQEEGLCVLGAGSCDDLDLAQLVGAFESVHLVDIDGSALARGIARLEEPDFRERVVPHGGIDLAGCLGEVDQWEKEIPALDVLLPGASAAADSTVAAIGAGPFDVVLSSCVLTQLWAPLQRTLVLTQAEWSRVFARIALTHLLTMAKLTRRGGTAILATEVEQDGAPVPSMELLLTLLHDHPELFSLTDKTRFLEPWRWTLDGRTALAHALLFRRAPS